jgi:hypothetical protein
LRRLKAHLLDRVQGRKIFRQAQAIIHSPTLLHPLSPRSMRNKKPSPQ